MRPSIHLLTLAAMLLACSSEIDLASDHSGVGNAGAGGSPSTGQGGTAGSSGGGDNQPKSCGDCRYPTPLCDSSTGECVECLSDLNCDEYGNHCFPNGRCGQCQNDTLCEGSPFGSFCQLKGTGVAHCGCSGDDSECSTSPAGHRCSADTSNRTCSCKSNADCDAGQACQREVSSDAFPRHCAAACQSDNDCAHDPAHPHCDASSGVCETCLQDTDCGTGRFCNQEYRTCVDCYQDADCSVSPDGPFCHSIGCGCLTNADCVGHSGGSICDVRLTCSCESDLDCTDGNFCIQGSLGNDRHCKPPCTVDEDCKNTDSPYDPHRCDTSTGRCGQCLANADCPSGVCDFASQRCVYCHDGVDCQYALPCAGNGDCAGNPSGPLCIDGRCGCQVETDCSGNARGQSCMDNQCYCANTSECANSNLGHACLPGEKDRCGCTSDADCPAGKTCDVSKLGPDGNFYPFPTCQ